jgi:hypothetical protein
MKGLAFTLMALFLMVDISGRTQNPRMHLIEDGTYVFCGHCPCNDSVIRHNVIPRVPNTSFIRYHWSYSGLHTDGADSLLKAMSVRLNAFGIDRNGTIYTEPQFVKGYNQLCDKIVADMLQDNEAPVKILLKQKNYNSQTREFSFSAEFSPYQSDLNGDFMINAVITESKILFTQAFLDSCGKEPQGKYIIQHHNVARKIAYLPIGDPLKTGPWLKTEPVTRNFSMVIDSAWVPDNCEFSVIVYKKEDSVYKSKVQQVLREAITSPLGLDDQKPESTVTMRIHPVPATEIVNAHVTFPEKGTGTITLLDLQGKVMQEPQLFRASRDTYNFEFLITDYPEGQYLLKVDFNGRSYVEKFLHLRKF